MVPTSSVKAHFLLSGSIRVIGPLCGHGGFIEADTARACESGEFGAQPVLALIVQSDFKPFPTFRRKGTFESPS